MADKVLHAPNGDIEVQGLLGTGCFGVVMKGMRIKTAEDLAVKIVVRDDTRKDSENHEIAILRSLGPDIDQHHIVRFYESFSFMDRTYLVFEMLQISLKEFIYNDPERLAIEHVRSISAQLLKALDRLKNIGVVHTDVKPDNVMLVSNSPPYRVKLIDFGLALKISQLVCSRRRQPIAYRAPEVFLGLRHTESIDLWSLGCVMAELFLRFKLFSSESEYDAVRSISKILGPMPAVLLDDAPYADCFFTQHKHKKRDAVWKLMSSREYAEYEMIPYSPAKKRPNKFRSLYEIVTIRELSAGKTLDNKETSNLSEFVSLLEKMLALESEKRITPEGALSHSFFINSAMVQ